MSKLLAKFESEKLNEMALVDIAFEILRETNRPYNFRELMDEIARLRSLSDQQKMGIIAQVYTEVNIDGRFVCVGENTWGLKRWYPTETVEESQEGGKKKKVVLDDDFDDDFEIEEELVEEFEEDEITIFEEEEYVEDDAEIEEVDEELEEEEIADEEEVFADSEDELEEVVLDEDADDENDDI